MKKTILMFVFLLLSISVILSSETPSDSNIPSDFPDDSDEQKYYYAQHLDYFFRTVKDQKEQEKIIDNPRFTQGLRDYLDKNPESIKKLSSLWNKVDQDDAVLVSDKLKNKIFNFMGDEYRKQLVIEIFSEDLLRRYGDNAQGYIEKIRNSVFDLSNKNLVWKGSKLGILGDEEKLKVWIDSKDFPMWITGLNFNGDVMHAKYNNGFGEKEEKQNAGSKSATGAIISPDGNIFGSNLEVIRSELKTSEQGDIALHLTIKTRNLKGEEVEKTAVLDLKSLGLSELLENPKIKSAFENMDGLAVDMLGLGPDNQLNTLYGGSPDRTEKFEITFDKNGRLKVSGSNGATLVTTDSKGNVKFVYRQHYSKNGAVNSELVTPDDYLSSQGWEDEQAVFSFEKNGRFNGGQNTYVNIMNDGEFWTSRRKMQENIYIAENPLADALIRKDPARITELIQRDPRYAEALRNSPDEVLGTVAMILREQIISEGFASEIRNRLEEGLGVIEEHLRERFGNILQGFYKSENPTEGQNRIRDHVLGVLENQARGVIEDAFENPETLQSLLTDENKRKEFLLASAKKRLASPEVAEIMNQIIEQDKLLGPLKESFDFKINEQGFKAIIEGAFENYDPNANFETSVKNNVRSLFYKELGIKPGESVWWYGPLRGVIERSIDKVTQRIVDLKTSAETELPLFIDDLKREFQQRTTIEQGGIIIDPFSREVFARTGEYFRYNADTPLNGFYAASTRASNEPEGSVIILQSNGRTVAVFDRDKNGNPVTNTEWISNNYQGFVPIDTIKNLDQPDKEYSLKRFSNGAYDYGFTLYDKGNVDRSSRGGVITEKRYGFFGLRHKSVSVLEMYLQARGEGDIAEDPNAEVTIYDTRGNLYDRGFFGIFNNPIIERMIRKKSPYGFPTVPMADEANAKFLQKNFESQGIRTDEEYREYLQEQEKRITWLDSVGLGGLAPLDRRDELYAAQHPDEFYRVSNFLREREGRSPVKVTPTMLQVGNEYISSGTHNINPAIFRIYLRSTAKKVSEGFSYQSGGGSNCKRCRR